MKKFFILFAATLLVACSNQDSIESNPTLSSNVEAKSATKSNIRSYEDALKIAQYSISMIEGSKASTRGMSLGRKIDLNDSKVFKLDSKTRSASGINDTLIYVFNFENNEGFALISASKRTLPILAITEKGHCDPTVRSDKKGFNMFTDMAEKYVADSYLRDEIDTTEATYHLEYVFTNENYVGPYIPVTWGQGCPYGEYFSNLNCGCATTAIAQMMAYHQHPSSMTIEFGNEYGQTRYFNWSSMITHTGRHTYANCSTSQQEAHKSISILCKNIGINIGCYPLGIGTGAVGAYIRPYILDYFSTTDSNSWIYYNQYADIISDLDNGLPMFIDGRVSSSPGCDEHMWILDGYLEAMCTTNLYEIHNNQTSLILTTGPTPVTLYHFNWGWDGDFNGYFDGGVFNYISSKLYDTYTIIDENDIGIDYCYIVLILPIKGTI